MSAINHIPTAPIECRCQVCGHKWEPTPKVNEQGHIYYDRPRRCAKCKTPYWDVPPKKK